MKHQPWVQAFRISLRSEHGLGWSAVEQTGKVKLINRQPEGNSTCVLDLPWSPTSAQKVIQTITTLRGLMDQQCLTLADAGKLLKSTTKGSIEEVNWNLIARQFLATKESHRITTQKDYKTRINRALELLTGKPRPQTGAALMKLYANTYFENCPAGGQGRKRQLGDVAAFLSHAVTECGVPAKWLPIKGEKLDALIGNSSTTTSEKLTPPLKDDDFEALLNSLRADGKSDLYLAVGLVGLFGLRPAELAALRIDDQGMLWVGGQVKRNKRTMKTPKPDRFVIPIDLPSMPGEAQRILSLYSSGLQALPVSITNAIATGELKPVGDAFRQLLDRLPIWRSLQAKTPGLTPYSLRHSYAWRGTKSYEKQIPSRDLAAMMGHNLTTHQRHYGQWTDQMSALLSVANAVNSQPLQHTHV